MLAVLCFFVSYCRTAPIQNTLLPVRQMLWSWVDSLTRWDVSGALRNATVPHDLMQLIEKVHFYVLKSLNIWMEMHLTHVTFCPISVKVIEKRYFTRDPSQVSIWFFILCSKHGTILPHPFSTLEHNTILSPHQMTGFTERKRFNFKSLHYDWASDEAGAWTKTEHQTTLKEQPIITTYLCTSFPTLPSLSFPLSASLHLSHDRHSCFRYRYILTRGRFHHNLQLGWEQVYCMFKNFWCWYMGMCDCVAYCSNL